MAYFSKYFGKYILPVHFHPKSSPGSTAHDLVNACPKHLLGACYRHLTTTHLTKWLL